MTRWLSLLSLRVRLVLLCVLTAAIAVACSTIADSVFDNKAAMRDHKAYVETLTRIVGNNSKSAVVFADSDAANSILKSLDLDPSVEEASLYSADRKLLASYRRRPNQEHHPAFTPTMENSPTNGLDLNRFWVSERLTDADGLVGFIYVASSLDRIHQAQSRRFRNATFVLLATVLIAIVVASLLQAIISRPIQILDSTTQMICKQGDYSVRVTSHSKDEIGRLYESFNAMLAQIESSQNELQEAKEQLEIRVADRTNELSASNSKLTDEIEEHKKSQARLKQMQQELLESARAVGMADVATGVLHNVGNVLNSANVTTNILCDKIRQQKKSAGNVGKLSALLNDNRSELGPFFDQDSQGSQVIEYLNLLADQLNLSSSSFQEDLVKLREHIDHIKEIVAAQQSFAKMSGISTTIRFSELFDEALRLQESSFERHEIAVTFDIQADPIFESDKHRILQILVNLLNNAEQALTESSNRSHEIAIQVRNEGDFGIRATVRDNGIGIPLDKLEKIFSYGFTTKPNGHGFGLHASALAANELGGRLEVNSNGKGKGAEFSLVLPTNGITGMEAHNENEQ